MAIRDLRLYREDFATFKDCCRERWWFARDTGDRLIAAAEVAMVLTPTGVMPTGERQARELAPLRGEPEVMREVWQEVIERSDCLPTAALVREVHEELIAPRLGVHFSSATDEWSTPQDLFGQLNAEFGFGLTCVLRPRTRSAPAISTTKPTGWRRNGPASVDESTLRQRYR